MSEMALRLYNTLTRRKEPFKPLDPALVRMYVCGPTVYDYAHIGNARPVVVFDVLYRLLRHRYGPEHVFYVRNITDVDDKIINASAENRESITKLTKRYVEAFHDDMAALGALSPTKQPRARDYHDRIKKIIRRLLDAGYAYVEDGHVLFEVRKWPRYGELSRRSIEDQIAGARVEVAPFKRDPRDFVLWKPSKEGGPRWNGGDWGTGYPGWHIECSAMTEAYFGKTFDIHGGGQDLIFPHHENEIAQSVCSHGGEPFAKYWLHNGYLMAEGEKMSKSLGNFYTVRDLLHEFPGEAIRLLLLKTHYRQPLDFTKEGLAQAKAELDRFYTALRVTGVSAADEADEPPEEVVAALDDDLNTPLALSGIHALVNRVFQAQEAGAPIPAAEKAITSAGRLLGILQQDPEAWFKGGVAADKKGEIKSLIARREAARKARDFAEADRIRDALRTMGVELEDRPDGTTDWRRVG